MGQDFPDFFLTGSQVEFVIRRGHGIGGQVPVHVFTDLVVGTPVPGRGQDGIPGFRIVPDCMVDGTGAAGRGDSCGESFRTGLAEAGVLDQFQVFRQSHDGSVLEVFRIFQSTEYVADCGQHHKVFIVVQDASDGGVDHCICADFTDPFLGGFTGPENTVLGRFCLFLRMRCYTAVHHNDRSSPQ